VDRLRAAVGQPDAERNAVGPWPQECRPFHRLIHGDADAGAFERIRCDAGEIARAEEPRFGHFVQPAPVRLLPCRAYGVDRTEAGVGGDAFGNPQTHIADFGRTGQDDLAGVFVRVNVERAGLVEVRATGNRRQDGR